MFIIHDLQRLQAAIEQSESPLTFNSEADQITHFTEDDLKGKNLSEGEEFWFTGADGKKVQGWALKPSGWKAGQTKAYPVLLLIHGGPQGAWEDQWSTRWNPNGNQSRRLLMMGSNAL